MVKILFLELFLFCQLLYRKKRYQHCQHKSMIQLCLMLNAFCKLFIYIRKRSGPKIKFLLSTKIYQCRIWKDIFLFEMYDFESFNDWWLKPSMFYLILEVSFWSKVSQAFCWSTRIIIMWMLLSIPLKIKSISCTKQEFEKFKQ